MDTLTQPAVHSALRTRVEGGIARVDIDLLGSKVNKLTTSLMTELESLLEALAGASEVRGIVLASGKPDTFVAGADIDEIESLSSVEEARDKSRFGQRVFERIDSSPKPVVAAIHGACLGGGCELALACHHRIASDDSATRLGLPEVKLGIVPGFGGTQRLPRVVGLQASLDLILTGRLLDARAAHRIGLVDALAYPALLVEEAVRAAERLAAAGRFRSGRSSRHALFSVPGFLDRTALGREIVLGAARRRVRAQTGGHYPAPLAALDAVQAGLRTDGLAFEREAELLARMALTPESRNLVQLYRLTEANKRLGRDLPPAAEVRQIAVVGAGVMGGGIAQLAAYHDIRVRLKDIATEPLLVALRTCRDLLQDAVGRRRLEPAAATAKLAFVGPTLDYSGFALADVVVEAVVEKLEVKKRVLQEIESHVRPECVLATNTSALSVTGMAEVLGDPGRLVGLHFFNPVHRMPLVEVVVSQYTRPAVVSAAVALSRRLGKTPVVVRDAPGFLVNRILAPYLNESARLFEAGADVVWLDRLMRRFGMPMGPFELLDEVGTDVAREVGVTLHAGLGEHMQPAALAARLAAAGRLGRKCGAGMYRWQGRRRQPDHKFWSTLRPASVRAARYSGEHVLERVFGLMINEAARCLDEKLVAGPADLDLALVFGIGYPPFRGGLLRWADGRGLQSLVESLQRLAGAQGPRFAPCARLVRMAARGERFHAENRRGPGLDAIEPGLDGTH